MFRDASHVAARARPSSADGGRSWPSGAAAAAATPDPRFAKSDLGSLPLAQVRLHVAPR